MRGTRWSCVAMLALTGLAPTWARGDEGMWLFNNLPLEHLQQRHGFAPEPDWAERVMLACVRFNVGGSASFVSSNGLVLTNHHVASDTLHKLSTAEHNYLSDGFLARTPDEELRAPDLELNQLVGIDDVTDRVKRAVQDGMSSAEAVAARRAVIAAIEEEATKRTGQRCDVITLYGGGRYHLYHYKKYTDVRLVWAPEAAIAFFGGDADNFEYPRYCLDATLFRVYEDGKPAKTPHHFTWSPAGPKENELVFVAGNPGRTSRIFTHAAMKFQRDHRVPYVLDFIRRREILLQQFGLRGDEQARRAKDDLFGIQNARKAYLGEIQGLQDPVLMESKRKSEQELLAKLRQDPKLSKHVGAWERVAQVQEERKTLLGQGISLRTGLFEIAQTLVQLAAEDQKPNEKRLEEYRDSGRESLEQQLFSPAPIYLDLEQVVLGDLLGRMAERRGGDDPLVVRMLDGKSPLERAAQLVGGTKLHEVERRRELAKGGQAAIDACDDPLIQFARLLDPDVRQFREREEELDETEKQAYAEIAEALFATQGTSNYPDATFTLRLAFGPVVGYEEGGKRQPPWTTIGGAFEHERAHGAKGDYQLPKRWHEARERLPLDTPFDFVSTADIIGGNSGSPVFNRDLELVGLIFDGNLQSLTGDYYYSDTQSRSISVHSSAIREALRTVYGADRLAEQLGK